MRIRWIIETIDETPSTQDAVKERASAGADEGLVIAAKRQTAGRGRHGRVWDSREGNIFFSVLLRPAIEARKMGQLGLIAGAALAETIAPLLKHPALLKLKWPNDVLLDGAKCAGILVETDGAAILGVGVNVVAAPEGSDCVGRHAARPVAVDVFLKDFLGHFGVLYGGWQARGFDAARRTWLKYAPDADAGAPMKVKIGDDPLDGLFEGIDGEGNLLLKTENGIKVIAAGEIYN